MTIATKKLLAKIGSNYFDFALHGLIANQTASKIARRLRRDKLKFDAIAFTGMSGALMAPLVAAKMGCPLVLVRKTNENTHSSMIVEGLKGKFDYLIIDDCIASGDTIRDIISKIKKEHYRARCIGITLYEHAHHNGMFVIKKPEEHTIELSDFKGRMKDIPVYVFLNIGDILMVESNQLAGMPPLIDVQIDDILWGESPVTRGVLLGYSARVVGSNTCWLVMPEDIVYKYPIH